MAMTNVNAFELQHSDLNGFLFADIGVEAGGMDLSVMSALAREGVDPWQEAARLAKLPWATAVDELARMIAGMPASLWPQPVATEIATRLVRMLPGREGGAQGASHGASSTMAHTFDAAGLFGSAAGAKTLGTKTGIKPELLIVVLLGLAILAGSAIGIAHAPPAAPPTDITSPIGSLPRPPAPPGGG
jgi:hypothetical protein